MSLPLLLQGKQPGVSDPLFGALPDPAPCTVGVAHAPIVPRMSGTNGPVNEHSVIRSGSGKCKSSPEHESKTASGL